MKKLFIALFFFGSFYIAADFDQQQHNQVDYTLFPQWERADSILNCTRSNGFDGRYGDLWCEIASGHAY